MKEIKIKRALISLTDKRGVEEFAKSLIRHGVEILSTGGTAQKLRGSDIPVVDVSTVTNFPEIMDGRVKTLHPKIYGGLLALEEQETHKREMKEHGIEPIDLVAVNLYAFAEKTAEPGVSLEEAMDQVDIGGPCMIRAAAKNHQRVTVIVDPGDYGLICEEMDDKDGAVSEETRVKLAIKAFELTAAYDAGIHLYLRNNRLREAFPHRFTLPTSRGIPLRYGENPHQAGIFYPLEGVRGPNISRARQLGGKELSYNNLLDTDAAFELVKEFDEPAAVMVKHSNPCGAATGATIQEAFRNAYSGDPLSAFGGIAALNRPLDVELAEEIATPERFLEVLITPDCPPEAYKVLRKKVRWGKSLRVLSAGSWDKEKSADHDITFRSLTGGILVQERDVGFGREELKVVTEAKPDKDTMASLLFAWKVVKHVRSNAIVLAQETRLVGVGAGQMSRIDSVRIAGMKAGKRAKGTVMASDAFFPFRDCLDAAAELGVKAVIQPGGSKRDSESIKAADEHGIPLVFTGTRHFRH